MKKLKLNRDIDEYKWDRMYKLAQAYYDYHDNLDIPTSFRTVNGYKYADDGDQLGSWIHNQRNAYKNQGTTILTTERIRKLETIGMIWNVDEYRWDKMSEYARVYHDYHGNLDVSRTFKTNNGYKYDLGGVNFGSWIATQRAAYKGQGTFKITGKKIRKLESIGIKWFPNDIDDKLQKERITPENNKRKQIEILNRTRSLLNELMDLETEPFESFEDIHQINNAFMKKLNHIKIR